MTATWGGPVEEEETDLVFMTMTVLRRSQNMTGTVAGEALHGRRPIHDQADEGTRHITTGTKPISLHTSGVRGTNGRVHMCFISSTCWRANYTTYRRTKMKHTKTIYIHIKGRLRIYVNTDMLNIFSAVFISVVKHHIMVTFIHSK